MTFLYSLFDNKSKSYGPIFGVKHDAVAIREFGAAVANPDSPIGKYPDDFELHCIGEFEDADFDNSENKRLMPLYPVEPRVVITARQWLDAQPRKDGAQLSLLEGTK